MKAVKVEYTNVRVPTSIVVDGISYPITGRNVDIVREYIKTKDDLVLDKLSEAVISFD